MNPLIRAVLDALDDEGLDELERRLAARRTLDADPDELFDVKGAAAYLCCRDRRIYDLVSQRRVTVTRDGGRVLFRRKDLDDHLETEPAA